MNTAAIYEQYYELCKQSMYAQVDLPLDERAGFNRRTCWALMRERLAVVDCWRSASQVPPGGC